MYGYQACVLVKTPEESRVVRVPLASAAPSGRTLRGRLEQAVWLGPGSVESLDFRNQPLSGEEDVVRAGVSVGTSSGAGGAGLDEALYPNGWFASTLSKVYQKPLDPSWPPLRHTDYSASLRWVVAALVALIATSLTRVL